MQSIKYLNLVYCQFILMFVFSTSLIVSAQETNKFDKDLKKYKDLFTFHPNKKKASQDSTLYPSKFIVAPIVSFSPETSLAFGAGAKYLFKFAGSGDETRTSNMPMSFRYTLNNQFILFSGFEIFTNQEKWVITGNILFQNLPQLYYGIGRDTSKENEERFDFFQALVEPILQKQVLFDHFFVGAGIRYNRIFNVDINKTGLLDTNRPIGYNGSTSVGAEFAMLYDSRNNILNANRGWFLEFTHGIYRKSLGSTYLERHLIATQVEYRKQFKNTRWGAVVFVGGGDVGDKLSSFKLKNIRPNGGFGLRFLLDKEENLNVRADLGIGNEKANVYLNLSEAF